MALLGPDEQPQSKPPVWLQQFIPIILTAALTWGGSYFTMQMGQAVRAALTDQKLEALAGQVSELKSVLQDGTRSRYTSEMATADRGVMMAQIITNTNALAALADQVATLREFKAATEARIHP